MDRRKVAMTRRLEQRHLTLGGNIAQKAMPIAGANALWAVGVLASGLFASGFWYAGGGSTTTFAVVFDTPEHDANYGVVATPSFSTTVWISNIATTGYTINFGTAIPDANQVVHAVTFREV